MARGILKPSRIAAIALVVFAVSWIASGSLSPRAAEEPATPAAKTQPPRKIGFTAVTPEPHVRQVVLSGVTQADKRAQAVARGAGVVMDVKVARGTTVKAGDTIATISDEGRDAAVKQAQALVDQKQADLEAQRQLIQRGDLPRNQLNSLQAAVAAAQATLATATAEAQKTTVKAPIAGRIESVPVEVGQAVQIGTVVGEMVSPDPMLAVGQVSEKDRGALQIGQKVTAKFIDGGTADGSVSFIGLTADKTTRTYRVEAKIPNADAKIADGVTTEISIALSPVPGASLPLSALVFADDGRLGARIVDDAGLVKFIPLTILGTDRGIAWVSGLTGSTKVITLGQEFVKDGDPVQAVPAAEAGKAGAPA